MTGRSNGFFLQVESASIDKQDHAANACGQIGETEQIDEAVQTALAFAQRDRKHPGHRHGRPRPHQPDRGRATSWAEHQARHA